MKKDKIIFWVATIIIFLFEGVMPALTGNSDMAKEAMNALGYPAYFGIQLTIWKVLGALTLIIPAMPKRLKEWAYAGFGFSLIFAFTSLWATYGIQPMLLMPVVIFGILAVSYCYYHKLNSNK